ncbi:MAG: hypothetical protein Q9180_002404 [Flavoplaca navasiana]
MDTEPGGEGNQYESIQTVTNPHSKQGGQMGEPETQPDAVKEQQAQDKADRGARTAENVRYGQTISEGGMGGKTTEAGGSANQAMAPRMDKPVKTVPKRHAKNKDMAQALELALEVRQRGVTLAI